MIHKLSDIEIASAICCGEHCRTDTSHCHALDHFAEAYRVRRLLERTGMVVEHFNLERKTNGD